DDPRLKARALRAAGELGRADLLDAVRAELRADGDERRYWASWSAALLGDDAAPQELWSLADAGGPFAERACAVSVRRLDPREPPEDAAVALDPDWQLRWPAPKAIAAWWSAHEGRFRRGSRYLRGAPMSDEALERELALGTQRRRASAALELGLRRPGRPLA